MPASSSFLRVVLSVLLASGLSAIAPLLTAQGLEQHKLLPTDGSAGDSFGAAIATDGVVVAVGAPGADESGPDSGTAYLCAALSGAQRLELVPNDGFPGDRLGAAISVDGGRVAVGAPLADGVGPDSGAVYLFDATTGVQLHKLQANDAAAGDQFGHAVAMDGNLVVIGTLGSAYVFDVATGQQLRKLLPSGASTTFNLSGFGEAVAIDSGLIVVGARLENGVSGIAGACYVFDAVSGNQLHRLVAADGTAWANFGASVALGAGVLAIGAPETSQSGWHSGVAYLFDPATGQQLIRLVPGDGHLQAKFGSSVGVDGLHVVIGAEQNNGGAFAGGAAYVYDARNAGFVVKLTASDAASNDELGVAVAVRNGVIAAGAHRDDDNGADSGAAYVFGAAGTVTPMAQCLTNSGTLGHCGGLPVAGQTLVFCMDGAQAGAGSVVLAVSANPIPGWPSCGLDLGAPGELLIAAPYLFITGSWSGSPVDLTLTVPSAGGLIGLRFYVQGAFLAPSSPTHPVRLTGGLEVLLGGYL